MVLSCRFVDDRFDVSVGGVNSHDWRYFSVYSDGYYPDCYAGKPFPVELEDVDTRGHQVNYLDFSAWKDAHSQCIFTTLYDKRQHGASAGFFRGYRTFPHVDAFLSNTSKYGVVSSQCARFARKCTCATHFISLMAVLLLKFKTEGYSAHSLYRRFTRFVKSSKWNRTLGKNEHIIRRMLHLLTAEGFFL